MEGHLAYQKSSPKRETFTAIFPCIQGNFYHRLLTKLLSNWDIGDKFKFFYHKLLTKLLSNCDVMNLYEIRESVLKTGKLVWSSGELANYLQLPKDILSVYIHRMKKKGLVSIVHKKICFTDNDFIIANNLVTPSYISMKTALFLHGQLQQIPFTIELVTPVNSRIIDNYKYFRINPKLFFGYEKVNIDNSSVYVATVEKAIIDGIYYNNISRSTIDEIDYDSNVLRKYLEIMEGLKFRGKKKLIKFMEELL